MSTTGKKKTIKEIRPIVSATLPNNNLLQIVNVKEKDNVEDAKPGIHIRLADGAGQIIPLAFIESIMGDAERRKRPQNVLEIEPLVKIKAFSSVLEVREVEEGEDGNLKPGAYYRWVRPYGSVVIPVLVEPDGKVKILMQQVYRHQTAKFGWELPMGGVEKDETPPEAAKREFREETGLAATQVRIAFDGYTDPGTSTARETFYVAQGLRKVGGRKEENETIGNLKAFSLTESLNMIDSGEISGVETIAGILHIYRMANEGKLKYVAEANPIKTQLRK